ncbi:MAG TPA: PQQ-binding-like beta-propeller repeat protein [Methylomirabilota bacterium]|nr:PQQ-binding-like beta-propeller repeat protein [Methylomirabilota bacterium]
MSRSIALVLLAIAVFASASCGLTVRPATWTQIHSEKTNTGFNAVRSVLADPQVKLWSAPVGQLSVSSPAVGPDGTVYIGNLAGEAVAINPDGTPRWRRLLGSRIVATPAVHTQTGEIVFVVQNPLTQTDYLSFLYRLSPAGDILAVSTEQNLFTSSAPKIWREHVFLQTGVRYGQGGETIVAGGYVYVFDRTRLQVVAKAAPSCGHPICGGSGFFEHLLEMLSCLVQLQIPAHCRDFEGKPGPTHEPSVAIVDARNAVDDPDRPTVLAATGLCAVAMRFDPSATFDHRLRQLWGQKLVGDCADPVWCASPTVTPGGQVVFGAATYRYDKGRTRSFDVRTGVQLWERDLDAAVRWAPVAFLRQIYVVTSDRLVVLDSDGTPSHEAPLQGTGHAAALSLEHVHVTTSAGVHTFRLDPRQGSSFDGTIADPGVTWPARAIPALAQDGTLYVSTPNGFLHAYRPGSP